MEKIRKLLMQAVRFGLVGVVNTLVDYIVTNALVLIPFFERNYVAANCLGFLCGMANSLLMNKRWTFAQKERMTIRQIVRFVVVNLLALLVSSLVLTFTQEKLDLPFFIGKGMAVAFSVGITFVGSKLLVFREK